MQLACTVTCCILFCLIIIHLFVHALQLLSGLCWLPKWFWCPFSILNHELFFTHIMFYFTRGNNDNSKIFHLKFSLNIWKITIICTAHIIYMWQCYLNQLSRWQWPSTTLFLLWQVRPQLTSLITSSRSNVGHPSARGLARGGGSCRLSVLCIQTLTAYHLNFSSFWS